MTYRYQIAGQDNPAQIRITQQGQALRVHYGQETYQLNLLEANAGVLSFSLNGQRHKAVVARQGNDFYVALSGKTFHFQRDDGRLKRVQAGMGPGEAIIKASMTGTVMAVNVSAGDTVSKGQTLVILEAMKMELRLKAARNGTVEQVNCQPGQLVDQGQVLVKLASED